MKKEPYVPLKATAIPLQDGLSFSQDEPVLLQQVEKQISSQQQEEPTDPSRTQE